MTESQCDNGGIDNAYLLGRSRESVSQAQSSFTMAEKQRSSVSWTRLAAIPVIVAALVAYAPSLQSLFTSSNPTVTIAQGTIIGREIDDGTYPAPLEGFMGIPFALPPVMERRFRPAVPVPDGNGTLEAFYMGPRCV